MCYPRGARDMPTLKLTDAAVQKFKAQPGERVEYFDATLPGFGLRVAGPTPPTPEGRKSWVLFYRHAGAQKRLPPSPCPTLRWVWVMPANKPATRCC